MATKIRNVELLTLARSDAGIPVLGHVGVGIDANLIQDFEMALSRVSEADQFHLALNTEGTITDSGSGGIAFTHGSSAETVLASIKLLHKATGYPDLSFNTRNVSDALLIKADGSVGINTTGANWTNAQLRVVASSGNNYAARFTKGATNYYFAEGVLYANTTSALHLLNQSGPLRLGANNAEVMRLSDGKVGIGLGGDEPTHFLHVKHNTTTNTYAFIENTTAGNAGIKLKNNQGEFTIIANDRLRFISDDSPSVEVMSLHPNGNVGIGTGSNTPEAKLHVDGGSEGAEIIVNGPTSASACSVRIGQGIAGSATDRGTFLTHYSSGNEFRINNLGQTNSITTFYTRPSVGSAAERMRIDSSGDVSLRTQGAKLSFLEDGSSAYMSIKNAAGPKLQVLNSTDGVIATFDNGGSVGIGTGSNAPAAKLEIYDSTINSLDLLHLRTEADSVNDYVGLKFAGSTDGNGATLALSAIRSYGGPSAGDSYLALLTSTDSDGSNVLVQGLVQDHRGYIGIGTGSSAPSQILEIKSSSQTKLLINRDAANDAELEFKNTEQSWTTGIDRSKGNAYAISTGTSLGSAALLVYTDGKVGVGTGSNTPASHLSIATNGANNTAAELGLWSTDTSIVDNDRIARISAQGSDSGGVAPYQGAKIEFSADADWDTSTNYYWPTRIDFFTQDASGVDRSATPRLTIDKDGKVGINTGSTTLTELLEVNGNVKATKFIGALEGTLETARNIVVGKSAAGAGDIDAITQSFDGGANISFDSELNSHLPSNLRGTTSSNIADEPSNNAVKIIGSDINTPRLKINRQGLIVGFEEVATSGGGGSGGISALTLNTNGLLYLNSGFTTQTETTSTSTPSLNLYLNAAGLFTAASMSFDNGGAYQSVLSLTVGGTTKTVDLDYDGLFTALTESSGTMSMTIGNTTKTLDLPNASFTQLDLSGTTLQVTVGGTQRTRDLSGLSVANATNATNADNIAINTTSTTGTRYITFTTNTSGDRQIFTDTGLTFQPSSNTLTATTFSGALSGNATTSSGLLVGSTTYDPVYSATGNTVVIRNSAGDINARYLLGTYVNTSDNVQNSNISYIMAKFGDNYHRSATADKVRAFLGSNRFLPTPSGGVYNITVSNATSATSASNATTATRLLTTTNGVVKTINSNGTLSIGSLSSGDIPNNAANTSGNAATATTASTLSWSGSGRSADLAANANTIVVRGSGGAINTGALSCTSISASTSITSSTTITAQKIVATNTTDSIRAKDIRPNGTVSTFESGPFPPLFYGVTGSKIGDHTSSSIGGFENLSAFNIFYQYGQAFSDRRMKDNISDFDLGLDFIRLLQPKSYTYKGSETPRNHYGVIAQDIEEVISSLNIENPSFVSLHDYHNKTEEENETQLKSYDPQQIMWVLFNAVKQLDAEVQDLKKQLEEK